MHVGRDLPDALNRGTGVLREVDGALGGLVPGLSKIITAHDCRAPVLRADPDEQSWWLTTGVDADAGNLTHQEVRAIQRPDIPVVGPGQPESLAYADGHECLGHASESVADHRPGQRFGHAPRWLSGMHHVPQRTLPRKRGDLLPQQGNGPRYKGTGCPAHVR